jgi:hypothetical protein
MKKNTSSDLIFPSDNPSFEEVSAIKQILAAAGFPDHDQEWLVRAFARPDCFGDPDGASVFREDFTDFFEYALPGVVDALGASVQTEADRQNRLALLFSFLLGFGPTYGDPRPRVRLEKSNDDWKTPDWVIEFQRQATFCATKLDWERLYEIRNSRSFLFHDLVPFLFPKGFPLNQVIELDSLNAIQRRGWSSNDFGHPNLLEFWLIWRFNDNSRRCETVRLDTLLPIFREYPETELSDKILGLLNAITYALNIALGPGASLNEGWRLVAHELLPFFQLLSAKHPETHQERSTLTKAWWRISQTIYGWSMGGLESELPDELRTRLVESAAKHMGFLRKMLRESPEEFKGEEAPNVQISDFYKEAFYALLCFAPPWKRLRPLLLAFTEMTVQAVASDLRPWPDDPDREPPPHPYSNIPMWIEISMYPQNLKNELERDRRLQALREEFAKFCMARLKTKESGIHKRNEDFVEPRPVWRGCYVQALTALRVNPGGRAHKTLFWTANNDPGETVRGLAKRAHRQIRRLDRGKPNLDVGASPRRPLFQAFWWLRQAHLLTLGIKIDKSGAQRTLRKDLHRTREKDDFPRRRRSS